MRSIYLDYCTTTPVAASVRESMLPFLSEYYGHPSSSHWFGRAAQEAIEDARSNLALLLGCHPSEIVFTSGGTESVNLGILGVARAITRNTPGLTPHLITTQIEHVCVRECVAQLVEEGWDVSCVGCNSAGVVQPEDIESEVRESTRIISLIHANHRIGTIQPVSRVSAICQQHDILLHTDAAQSVGKIDCNVNRLGVDVLSLSGHKFYAPKGIGALFIRTGVPIEPILRGEGSEAGIRPGTANVPHIVALGQASKLALAGLESSIELTTQYRDRFHQQLQHMLGREIRVHGVGADRLPGLLSLELPGVSADDIQQKLPEICFGPSSGSSHHTTRRACIRTHAAMGLSEHESASTLRVSFGWTTSEEELQQAIRMIATAYESLVN